MTIKNKLSFSDNIDSVIGWLINPQINLKQSDIFITEFCQKLRDAGLSLDRLYLPIPTLHPQLLSIGFLWKLGLPIAERQEREHGIELTSMYLESPIRLIFETDIPHLRRRLTDLKQPYEFPIFEELIKDGLTDYLILPIFFRNYPRKGCIVFATKNPEGFSDSDINALKNVISVFSLILQIMAEQTITSTLLDTYLGHDAGQKVLSGLIKRGAGVSITAALWYCDLRGFTELSEKLPKDSLIELLNEYFACMGKSIYKFGGEILKFIGDAALAIFPILDDFDRDRACLTALDAAQEALQNLTLLNQERITKGLFALRAGLALHVGSVTYGNIGTPNRLDFTVIGPAVNIVSRMAGLCSPLGKTLIASEQFASPCGLKMISLGKHKLRGIEEEKELFSLN
ncbi:MAG: adenylate/guanylate cyclase domain-containing protein [Alphaproteobacteria bacterium]|nr:adenylate/guanylate cyclase domain-containing protein [Alphaproteobacteria bacterium]